MTAYCNKRIAIFDERMSENSQRLYSSLDVRDQKIHDRFLKQLLDGEKFQKSMEQRVKDLVRRAETEVSSQPFWVITVFSEKKQNSTIGSMIGALGRSKEVRLGMSLNWTPR